MPWVGLDIGGANLKLADGRGRALCRPFPLWKHPQRLPAELAQLLEGVAEGDSLAVTMTGELADCFATKREGVCAILDALAEASDGRATRVYLTDGSWAEPEAARERPMEAAASNWRALAQLAVDDFLGDRAGLMIDIGSTTADIIPLAAGSVAARGGADLQRLLAGELVYTGVVRSPVCALVSELPWRGQSCPVAQEVFATTWDAYLLLEELPEEPKRTDTADGRPATKAAARDRLARCLCADRETFSLDDALAAARAIARAQIDLLRQAAQRVMADLASMPQVIVISGGGEFLARRLLERLEIPASIVSLRDQIGTTASQCAAAHAVAVLASRADLP